MKGPAWQGTAEQPDVRTVRLPDIKRKLFNRNAVAKDRGNNSIAPGDPVTLEDTRLRGRAGTVKYIHMGALFLHARCAGLQNGAAAARCSACLLHVGSVGRLRDFACDLVQSEGSHKHEQHSLIIDKSCTLCPYAQHVQVSSLQKLIKGLTCVHNASYMFPASCMRHMCPHI